MATKLGQFNKDTYVQQTDSNGTITDLKFKSANKNDVTVGHDNSKVTFKDNNGTSLSVEVALAATTADKLTTLNAGSSTTPVYFNNGIPVEITSYTGNVTGDVTGDVIGNVTGNVTGNVSGDVIGNVSGDVTGNAETATALKIGGIKYNLGIDTVTNKDGNEISVLTLVNS